MTSLIDFCACMIVCLMSGIALNLAQIILKECLHFKILGGTLIPFPYLTTELCRRGEVEKYPIDT